MQNKLQTIREACIKAIPSILELKFGCETNGGKVIFVDKAVNCMLTLEEGNNTRIFSTDNELLKILGRPIRLSDIVLAMQSKNIYGLFNVMNNTMFEHIGLEQGEKMFEWNSLKDNLTEQSEETINFIYNLLK